MTACGVRTTVIHRRTHGNTGRHLVIEQAAHFPPQERGNFGVQSIVCALSTRVDGAGEVPLERTGNVRHLMRVLCDDDKRAWTEDLGLQDVRCVQECISLYLQ